MFWFKGKSVKGVMDEVLRFFDRIETILGVFDELIEEGIEVLERVENEIREHERQIEELSKHKEEVASKIEGIKRILGITDDRGRSRH